MCTLIKTADDLGRAIRSRRRELGLDQRALAQRVGVSRQWLIEVEKGKRTAEVGLILRTFEALGLVLSIGYPAEPTVPALELPAIDLDAIIERAKDPEL